MEHHSQVLRRLLEQFTEKQGKEDHEDGAIAAEFLSLKRQSTKYRTERAYATKAAEKQENVKKNRYKDIVPFDHTRVTLSLNTSQNDTDYINANFIQGFRGQKAYIATQGPLPNTVVDFWRMLWEYNVQVVVMACREFEMGRKKCERYWPENDLKIYVCEPFVIHCETEEHRGDYLMRTLKVTFNNASRRVQQLHYINWPDHGVPNSIPPILEMLEEMRLYQEHDEVPICIHCSAGCGRTGALCVIDYTWNLLKNQIIPENFSIYELVKEMRRQRPSIVQTKEQYELVYRTVKVLFEKNLQIIEMNLQQNEVPKVSSPTFASADNNLLDFSELMAELEPVTEPMLHLHNDLRFLEKEIPLENLLPPQPCDPQPSHPPESGRKGTPADFLNESKNLARIKAGPKPAITPLQVLRRAKLGHQNSTDQDVVHHQPQIPENSLFLQTDLGYMSPILEPTALEQTNLGFQWPVPTLLLDSTSHQPIKTENHIYPRPACPLQQPDFQISEPSSLQITSPSFTPPGRTSGPGHQGSLLQQTNIVLPKPEVPKPPRQKQQSIFKKPPIPETAPPASIQAFGDPAEFSSLQKPPGEPTVPAQPEIQPSLCLTVEDPYFSPDSALINNSSSDLPEDRRQWTDNPGFIDSSLVLQNGTSDVTTQNRIPDVITPTSDEDSPPPLPERTPESYVLADKDEGPENQDLLLVIPSSIAPETNPPSPVPPLPERTPESFELANDADLMRNAVQENPQQVVHRMGRSSEWSGNSNSDTADIKRTWSRTKSLRARLSLHGESSATFTIQSQTAEPSLNTNPILQSVPDQSHIQPLVPIQPFTQELPPLLIPPASGRVSDAVPLQETSAALTPPLPERTPESYVLDNEEKRNSALCPSNLFQHNRLGTSSEWAGSPQSNTSQDVMSRCKSVKMKISKHDALPPAPPPPAAAAAQTHSPRPSPQPPAESTPMSSTGPPERMSLANRARTKSLKFLKGKPKQKTTPPSAGAPPPYGAATRSRFDFGFRFGKPKGPRTQPETWV